MFCRYLDDGFILWPSELDINTFITLLNDLNPSIKFTVERGTHTTENNNTSEKINFLDILIILKNSRIIQTDIFYKATNSHYYLDYHSHHPEHIKINIPYNLAKRIMVFVSDSIQEEHRLNELYRWLLNCNYPSTIIDKCFHNAKLQGPAPEPKKKENILTFTSTYYSNYNHKYTIKEINNLLQNNNKESIKKVFGNTSTVLALKQPPNLLRHISKASFSSTRNQEKRKQEWGLYTSDCRDSRCQLCKSYIQECNSFITSNGYNWLIKSHINCQSKNVLYFLKCIACEERTTYTGKTNDFQLRMNNHISSCRLGTSTNIFDNHVFNCRKYNQPSGPYFKIYAFMEIKNENLLLTYESYLHKKGFDTMNS